MLLAVAVLLLAPPLYLRGYRWARLLTLGGLTTLISLVVSEPRETHPFALALCVPPILALLVANAQWVLGTAVGSFVILLARDGPGSSYFETRGLWIAALFVVGLALARQLSDTARARAEAQARLIEAERSLLEQRVADRTRALAEANAELREANKQKDLFLAGVSHELRTPLNIVLGSVEILHEELHGPLNEQQHAILATVQENSHHLLHMINDLLDLVRLQSGNVVLNVGEVSVAELCEQCERLISQELERKGVTFLLTLDPTVTTIVGDQRRLRQILLNLLSNAVKFTPTGGRIGLDVRPVDEGQQVEFLVWDTGIGIAPDLIGRLFRPFTQLDPGLNREHEGTGLGLALVAQLVELHKGQVGVTSEPGKGSRFWVRLPVR